METWTEIFKSKKFWAAVIASLIAKEIMTRLSVMTASGAVRAWSRILFLVSLGSERVRDTPYASAAINPYAVPTLLLIVGLFFLFVIVLIYFFLFIYGQLIKGYLNRNKPEDRQANKGFWKDGKLRTGNVLLLLTATIYSGLLIYAAIIPIGVVNEAVLARRIYEANRDIAAPYLTSSELVQLQSDFAQIETKAQYKNLMNRLAAIGKDHHLKMHDVNW
jgi:hypothetical protein